MISPCRRLRCWGLQCEFRVYWFGVWHSGLTRLFSVQDPFEEYKKRLNAKLKKTDLSDEVQAERAARKAKREQDRTTWLGTNLGAKGDRRVAEESAAGVGKYLQGAKRAAPQSVEAAATPTEAKKPKKLGSFGDFSGW